MIADPILIVDDEAEVRETLLEALQSQGYTAEAVEGAEAALSLLAQRDFPVVLTDLNMPGGPSGLDLIAALRQRSPGTLCILITAYATLDTSIEALKQGAYDLIQKPFRLAEIQVVLDRALDHARLLNKLNAYREELESRILTRTQELRQVHQEALHLCDLSLQGASASTVAERILPFLDHVAARWSPEGLACYLKDDRRELSCLHQRGPKPLPTRLKQPGQAIQPPGLGYAEEHLVPLGLLGWIYLGFETRSAFSEAESAFLLLTRHMELALRLGPG